MSIYSRDSEVGGISIIATILLIICVIVYIFVDESSVRNLVTGIGGCSLAWLLFFLAIDAFVTLISIIFRRR
jgi:hypothetical protein